jgi:alkylresorcinol/alkylpyrone synthase
MNDTAALLSLATSVPPHQFHQQQILTAASGLMADRYPEFATLASLFANTGIRHRYGVKPMEWYLEPRGWPDRTQAFLEGAEALFVAVAEKALARADLRAEDIDTVVTVCSTGIATPTLEARVASRMGFRSDVSRVPVFGLGCAGGVSGLSIAARLAQSRPGDNVLMVALELCTLAVRHDELNKANIVAASLFGDGAAAVILRAGDGGATRVEASGEKLWPDTLDIMGWRVDPQGFGVVFQRTIPDFVCEQMGRRLPKSCRGWRCQLPTSIASSAIPEAQKSSRRWSARSRSTRARWITSATSSPTTATCRHQRCCSYWNGHAQAACRGARC